MKSRCRKELIIKAFECQIHMLFIANVVDIETQYRDIEMFEVYRNQFELIAPSSNEFPT